MFVFKSLLRRKLRSAFALGGVALSIAAMVALMASSRGFLRQFESIASRLRGEVIVQEYGMPDPMLSDLPIAERERLSAIPEVKEVYPLAHYISKISQRPGKVAEGQMAIKRLFVLLALPAGSELMKRHQLIDGRHVRRGKREMIIGSTVAEQMGYQIGDLFKVNKKLVLKIVGIFETGIHIVDSGALTSLEDYFALRGYEKVNMFVLDLHGGRSSIPVVLEKIRAGSDEFEALDSAQVLNHLEHLNLVKSFALGVSAIAACIAVIGVLNTMMMSVHERTREMGLLGAMGWSKRSIVTLILSEGILLALLGGVIGIIMGVVGTDLLLGTIDIGIIEARYPLNMLLGALVVSAGVGILGAVIPAWKAISISPVEALRNE